MVFQQNNCWKTLTDHIVELYRAKFEDQNIIIGLPSKISSSMFRSLSHMESFTLEIPFSNEEITVDIWCYD